MHTNRPFGPPTEEVIDLTHTDAIEGLIDSLTEQLTVTDAQRRDYQEVDRALTSLAHRSCELMQQVFESHDVAESESELQAA